jgi:hypothetical protein
VFWATTGAVATSAAPASRTADIGTQRIADPLWKSDRLECSRSRPHSGSARHEIGAVKLT